MQDNLINDLIKLSTTLHEMQRYAERQGGWEDKRNMDSCLLSSYTLKEVNTKLDQLIAKHMLATTQALPPAVRQMCRWQQIREKSLMLNPELA